MGNLVWDDLEAWGMTCMDAALDELGRQAKPWAVPRRDVTNVAFFHDPHDLRLRQRRLQSGERANLSKRSARGRCADAFAFGDAMIDASTLAGGWCMGPWATPAKKPGPWPT